MSEGAFRLGMYAVGFVLGFVLMGFEMLGSRYLNPYFGSGIYTWAALISVTLFALMIGYFIGGWLVDRRPTAGVLGGLVLLAAAWMALIPFATSVDAIAAVLVVALVHVILIAYETVRFRDARDRVRHGPSVEPPSPAL